jgi:hypothetical protein
MVWNLEPDDPPEPQDVQVSVCKDCHKAQDYAASNGECECENSSDFTLEWWTRCPDCREIFPDDDEWVKHECTGWEPDENDYFD